MTGWSRTAPGPVGQVGGQKRRRWLLPSFRPGLFTVAALNSLLSLIRLSAWLLRHPIRTATLALLAMSVAKFGLLTVGLSLLAIAALLLAWRQRWPDTYRMVVGDRLLARWRFARFFCLRWTSTVDNAHLVKVIKGIEYKPQLHRIVSNPWMDQVLVDTVNGQPIDDYENPKTRDGLARAFRANTCRVREDQGHPNRLWLDFQRRDALAGPIPALPIPEITDFEALPLGLTETGRPWLLQLLGSHVFIAGATGSGKGSVEWSTIRALLPAIHAGTARIWGADPKGGMELGKGEPLFHRLAENLDDICGMLQDAAAEMTRRARELRQAGIRRVDPDTRWPLQLVMVDELANVVYLDRDTNRKKTSAEAIQLLLTQGRAVGFVVMAAAQDPRKEILPWRNLFPQCIGLRLKEHQECDMVLGFGARTRGAECDRIHTDMQGTGFVAQEGVREPMRVRAAYVSDSDLHSMCTSQPEASASAPL